MKKAIAEGQHDPLHQPTPGHATSCKNVTHRRPAEDEAQPGASILELLFRHGVRDELRREALTGLAKLEKQERAAPCCSTRSRPG